MKFPTFTEDIGLAMSNAVLLSLCIIGFILLANYISHIILGISDLTGVVRRALNGRERGGTLDVAVSMALVILGFAIRTETAWEWRAFDSKLRVLQLTVGTLVTAAGILIMIKTLAPQNRWRIFFCFALTGSTLFAGLTWWLAVD